MELKIKDFKFETWQFTTKSSKVPFSLASYLINTLLNPYRIVVFKDRELFLM
jgi:hypothetical protein